MTDRKLLYFNAFLRALATGMVGVLIGIHLAKRDFDPAETGVVISVGLAGAAAAALMVTLLGDRLGRRLTLIILSVFGAVGGAVVALTANYTVMLAAAFIGMVNGMGRDRGAALILEQVILPATVSDAQRTRSFAWYNVLLDAGHAIGGLAAGLPVLFLRIDGMDEVTALQYAVLVYAGLQGLGVLAYARLSSAAEAPRRDTPLRITPQTRNRLWKISMLFAVDSLAGGFLTAALLAFFFYERFGVDIATVGVLFFAARVANAGSHLAAAWLARHIGLVNTMVFTHIPSSLLLATVAFAPNFPVAALLFLLRESLVEMDVPTRQSYVMAVVLPEERTFASGVTHLVRLAAWAVAPAFAGLLMQDGSLALPLIIGAGMKIAYDLILYIAFRGVKPPEERPVSG